MKGRKKGEEMVREGERVDVLLLVVGRERGEGQQFSKFLASLCHVDALTLLRISVRRYGSEEPRSRRRPIPIPMSRSCPSQPTQPTRKEEGVQSNPPLRLRLNTTSAPLFSSTSPLLMIHRCIFNLSCPISTLCRLVFTGNL